MQIVKSFRSQKGIQINLEMMILSRTKELLVIGSEYGTNLPYVLHSTVVPHHLRDEISISPSICNRMEESLVLV